MWQWKRVGVNRDGYDSYKVLKDARQENKMIWNVDIISFSLELAWICWDKTKMNVPNLQDYGYLLFDFIRYWLVSSLMLTILNKCVRFHQSDFFLLADFKAIFIAIFLLFFKCVVLLLIMSVLIDLWFYLIELVILSVILSLVRFGRRKVAIRKLLFTFLTH